MPTTSNGWTAHIQGVAAMMQSRGPSAFTDGIPHLLFVGFRPLIVRLCVAHWTHRSFQSGLGGFDQEENDFLDG
jgi:hypothetical protein